MTRWKASFLHLACSLVVIGGVAASGFLLWYPHGLYHVAEFDRILLVMFGVDLVAGPLLTLAVYRQGKRGMTFDLCVIALCQLAFFGYGMHTLWQVRPVFLVASEVRFNLVFANEIDAPALAAAGRPEWRRLSWLGPQQVGVRPPADAAARQALLLAYMRSGVDLDRMPRYYVEYRSVVPGLLRNAEPVEASSGLRSVPIASRFGVADMLVDGTTGEPVRVVRR